MSAEFDPDPFTEALRDDWPSAADEARVRARLAAAGVLAGVGAVAPGATAATTGTASTSVLAKALGLPLAAKVGATAVLVGAISVPIVRTKWLAHESARASVPSAAPARSHSALPSGVSQAEPGSVPAAGTRAAAADVALAPPASSTVGVAADVTSESAAANAASASAFVGPASPVVNRLSHARDSAAAGPDGASASRPAAGSFPVAAAPEDEGTLRAETALMEQALGALGRGDLARAKRKLAEHARTFPDGHLAPERDRALERVREKETER
ncbi:MAG TPA: hypothetical protein VMI54_28725 [Polyangiaceae bacterium]|nr:hypothetical protein [Polyangiaceae bacterium]